MKLDCYILTIPERKHFLEQCLSSLKSAEDRLNIIVYENPDMSISHAASYAIKNLVTTPIFTFISDDDLFVDYGAMEQCLRQLEDPECVGASTVQDIIDESGHTIRRRHNQEPYSKELHYTKATHVHEMVFLRKPLVEQYVDDTFRSLDVFHYWYLTMSVAQHGRWYKSGRVGHKWRMHPGNVHKTAKIHRMTVPPMVRKFDKTK